MMLMSHLIATGLVAALLARRSSWRPRDGLLALAFGVGIDVDHATRIPAFVASQGPAAVLDPARVLGWGAEWQGLMHAPWALLVVVPVAWAARSWAPVWAWGLHMVLDFVVALRFVRFGSPLEWGLAFGAAAVLAALLAGEHRARGAGRGFSRHVLARFGILAR